MQDAWFIELAKAQLKQDGIDKREGYFIPFNSSTDIYGEPTVKIVVGKKDIGRPPINWNIRNKVLELYDNSVELETQKMGKRLSLRAIAKLLNNEIGYVSVRNILIDYGRLKASKRNEKELKS